MTEGERMTTDVDPHYLETHFGQLTALLEDAGLYDEENTDG